MEQKSNYIEIEHIQIVLDTNISNNTEIPLTLSLLNTDYDQTYSQLPFFTSSCEFPINLFMKMTYSQIIKFFFNKYTFENTINEYYIQRHQTYEQQNQTIQNNVVIMLQYLLPTYPISNQLFSSFDLITSSNKKKTTSFQNNISQTMTIQEKKYNIKQVVWLNDLINQPKYVQLIDQFDKFMYWKTATKNDIIRQLDQLFLQHPEKDIGKGQNASSLLSSKVAEPPEKFVKTIEQQINLMFKIHIQVKPKTKYDSTYSYTNQIAELNLIVGKYKIIKENQADADRVILPYDMDKPTLFIIIKILFFLMKVPFDNNPITGFTDDDRQNYSKNKYTIDTYFILTTILFKYFENSLNFSFDTDDPIIKKYMKKYYGQYIDFKDLISEFVKPNFESTNPVLQTQIDSFLNNQSSDFAKKLYNIKRLRTNTKPEMISEELKKIMYVGASVLTSTRTSKFENIKDITYKYEIYVLIDLEPTTKPTDDIDITKNIINVKEKIQTLSNKLKVKCDSQNDNLVQIFQSLREGKPSANFNIKTNRKMLKSYSNKNGGNATHRRKRIYRNKTTKVLCKRILLRT